MLLLNYLVLFVVLQLHIQMTILHLIILLKYGIGTALNTCWFLLWKLPVFLAFIFTTNNVIGTGNNLEKPNCAYRYTYRKDSIQIIKNVSKNYKLARGILIFSVTLRAVIYFGLIDRENGLPWCDLSWNRLSLVTEKTHFR